MSSSGSSPGGRYGRHFRLALGAICFAFVVACVVLVLRRPTGVFWSVDSFHKHIQIESLRWDNGFRFDFPYSSRRWDPAGEFAPLGPTFFHVKDGELRLVWPLPFFLASYPFYRAFGANGLYALPILSGALVVWLTGTTAERIRAGRGLIAALIVATSTPVLTYSVLFWEHLPSVALALLGLALLAPRREDPWWRLVLGTASFALAAGAIRADIYVLFAVALVVRISAAKRPIRETILLGTTSLATSAPLWLMNIAVAGRALPLNAAQNFADTSQHYLLHPLSQILLELTLGTDPPAAIRAGFIGATAALIVLRFLARRGVRGADVASWIALGGVTWSCVGLTSVVRTTGLYHGLLGCVPGLVVAFVDLGRRPDEHPSRVFLRHTLWLYLPLYLLSLCLTSPLGPAAGAMEIAPRFAIPFYPALAIVAATISIPRASRKVAVLSALAAFLMGVRFQAAAITEVEARAARDFPVIRKLSTIREPLVTDLWWLPQFSVTTLISRPTYRVEGGRWAEWLARSGERHFVFATLGDPPRPPALASCVEVGRDRVADLVLKTLECP